MIPEFIIILGGCLLSGGIGALGVALYYRGALVRKERETWKAATLFHKHRTNES